MARLLIVGCGYVGSVLAERSLARGDAVFGLRRSDSPLPEGVHAIRADVAEPLGPDSLPDALDAVVYAVAAKSRDEATYRRAYVEGLHHVLEALEAAPGSPRRIVFTSSTAVYGQSAGEWVDEASPAEPPTFSGRILLEAEALLAASPIESTSLRLGGIYGPGRTSRLRAVLAGEASVRVGAPQYTNRIHRDDAADAIRLLLDAAHAPPVVLGVDDEPADQATVLDWMADRLGVQRPERISAAEAPAPRAGSKRCKNALLRSLGARLAYPDFRAGYETLLDEVAPS